jgi:hypothetical protein
MADLTGSRDGAKPEQRLIARADIKPRLHLRTVEQPAPGPRVCFARRLCFILVEMALGAVEPRGDGDAPALVLLLHQLVELRLGSGAVRLRSPDFVLRRFALDQFLEVLKAFEDRAEANFEVLPAGAEQLLRS